MRPDVGRAVLLEDVELGKDCQEGVKYWLLSWLDM